MCISEIRNETPPPGLPYLRTLRGIVAGGGECHVAPEPIRISRDNRTDADTQQPVAITQILEARVETLEQQFADLDAELRRRFGEKSYSVDRCEQVLAAIQRLRWALSRSPVVNPLPTPVMESDEAEE